MSSGCLASRRSVLSKESKKSQPPQCSSIKGLMVSIRWYLGCLKERVVGVCRVRKLFCTLTQSLAPQGPRSRVLGGPSGTFLSYYTGYLGG